MPILSGPLSSTRFRVMGALPETTEAWITALEPAWFVPAASASAKRVTGLCTVESPLDVDAKNDVNTWSYSNYCLFGWRIDEKKVDKRRFRELFAERCRAWKKENVREKVPAAVREEIKDDLMLGLLQKAEPTLRVIEVLVRLNDGIVLVDSTSTTILDEVKKMFRRVLGVGLEVDEYAGSLSDPMTEDEANTHFVATGWFDPGSGGFSCGSGPADPGPVRFTGSGLGGFFAWLWTLPNPKIGLEDGSTIEVYPDGEVRFRKPNVDKDEVIVALDTPTTSTEARAASKAGRLLTSMGLLLRREDREYTLRLGGPSLTVSRLKLPVQVKMGDVAERLFDRMFLYEEVAWILRMLVERYVGIMMDEADRKLFSAHWLVSLDDEAFEEA